MNLVETLRQETESFRTEYLDRVKAWAIAEFSRIDLLSQKRYTYEQFATPGFVKGPNSWSDYAQGKNYRKAVDARDAALRTVEKGSQAFIDKALTQAADHYFDSLVKLAARIDEKGLNPATLTVKTAHVNVNLDIVLTDGEQTVRAFTIIASGPVQRPHYRYLIK